MIPIDVAGAGADWERDATRLKVVRARRSHRAVVNLDDGAEAAGVTRQHADDVSSSSKACLAHPRGGAPSGCY